MWRDPTRNFDAAPLEADHSQSRKAQRAAGIAVSALRKADRLLHHTCNRQRGDGSRDALRPAVTGAWPGEEPTDPLGVRAMPWPALGAGAGNIPAPPSARLRR